MKIVYLTQYAIDGQFQSQFHNYSKLLNKEMSLEVVYLFPFKPDNSLIKSYHDNGVCVNSLGFKGFRLSISNLLKYINYIRKSKPDIVHSQHPIAGFYNKVGTTLFNFIFRRRIKIITEQRSVKGNLSPAAAILESKTNFLSNLILCSSDSVEKSYFNSVNYIDDYLSLKKGKHFTFYNSIDFRLLSSRVQTNADMFDNSYFNLCIVGRLEEVKQPLLVVEAIRHLKNYPIRLYIAGEGSLSNTIRENIIKYNLSDKVYLLGNIDWVPTLLNSCDLFINYSKHEGLCKALLEAMGMGKPVIVSKVPGNVEVVGENSEYGICIESKNPNALAFWILELFEKNNLYEKYASLSLNRSSNFNVNSQVKVLRKIYETILDCA